MAQAKKYLTKPRQNKNVHRKVEAPTIKQLEPVPVDDLQVIARRLTDMVTQQLEDVKAHIIEAIYLDLGLGVNPFLSKTWNITQQALAYRRSSSVADYMAKLAGHRGAIGAQMYEAKDYYRRPVIEPVPVPYVYGDTVPRRRGAKRRQTAAVAK